MMDLLRKFRHPWLWYAAGAEFVFVLIAVVVIRYIAADSSAQSQAASVMRPQPQTSVAHIAPTSVLGHLATDK